MRCDSVCPCSGHLGAWQVSGVRKIPASCTGARLREPQQRPNCRRRLLFFHSALARHIAAGPNLGLASDPRAGDWSLPRQRGHCRLLGSWWNPGKEKGRTLLRPFHNQHVNRVPHPRFPESHHNWVHAAGGVAQAFPLLCRKHRFTGVNFWHSSFAPLLPLGGEGRDEGASHSLVPLLL